MSTKLQVSKAVTKKNTATGGPVQSPGKVQNGTKKKSTEAAPKPRTSSGDGPPGGEVRKSSRPRKAKVWFEEGADATEEGADPVKYVGNNLDGEDVDNQKHEDEAEANGKSGDVGENEVDEAVDEAGDEPEEEDLAEDDAEEKADEEEGDEAEEEEGDEAEEEEGDEAEEEEGDEAEEEEDDEAEEEQDDEVEEEEDEESEEGQGDEDEAEKGSEKGDSAEVGEGADAHKPQITRKGSFDEMLEEQGDADDEDMEDEAVAEERAMLLGKLKALDEIKEPVVSSKPARKGVKRLPRSEPSKVPAKPPRGKDAVTSAKGKDKVLATDSILGGKSKREFALVVGGAQKKQNTGEVSAKPKSTPTAAGAGTSGGKAKAGAGASGVKAKAGAGASGVKAKAGAGTSGVKAKAGAGTSGVKAKAGAGAKPTSKEANTKTKVTFPPSLPSRIQSTAPNQYSGAAPPVKVITEATKRYELVPVKKTPFVAASCDRRQEHGGVSNVELDQFERRVMARHREVLASLRALFQHNDASTRGVFFEQLSSTRTSINGWMRKVALTALGRQANKCYLGRLPADLLAPLEFYTDEELIARYKDGERGLAWHRELLIPFGSLIFSVSIKLALARRGVNSEKIKTRQLGWILYAFEWPILNNAPDGKLSGKWEYNRIHIAEFLPSHPSPSSHLIRPLPPISSVPFFPSHPSPLFPSHPSPSSHLIRPLPPISSVPFFPSHPSPSSLLIRPLPPISSVPFLPSPSVPYASLHRLHDLHQPGLSPQTRNHGGAEQQGQQGDRCGAAGAAGGQVRSSSGSIGTGAEQQWQHGDRCGAAVAAWGQVWSSRGSMGTGAEQQWQHGDSAYRVSPSRFVVLAISGLNFTWVTDGEGCRWVGRDGSRVNGSVWYRDFMHPKTQTDSLAAFCQLWGNTSRAGGYLVMTMDGVEAAVFNERPGQPLEPPPDASLPVHLTWCSQPLYGTLDAGRVWVWAEYHRVHANVSRFIFYDMAAWTPALTALFTPYFAAGVAAVTDMSAGRRFGFVAGVELLYFTTKHQTLASNDCIYRSLFTSRWVTLHDTDEYLAPVPPHSLPSLLAAHAHAPWLSHGAFAVKPSVCEGEGGEDAPAPAEAATVEPADSGGGVGGGSAAVEAAGGGGGGGGGGDTRGAGAAVNARSRHEETALGAAGNGTEGGETQWDEAAGTEAKRRAVQLLSRMVFRHPDVWCLRDRAEGQRIDSDLCEDWRGHRKLIVNPRKRMELELCEDWRGHRKLIVNPRKTEVMSIHIAREPQKGGVVLNAATELRHFHFSGVVNPVNAHCQTLVPPGESHVWFVRDTTVADKLRLLVNSSAPQPEP
ncbi:unnamed protein product [Closterium sp. NIES-64]|nr:unnamed protein product [Closterium sp. NIES-64]